MYYDPAFITVFPEVTDGDIYQLGSVLSTDPKADDVAQTVTFTFSSVPAGYSWIVVDLSLGTSVYFPPDDAFDVLTYQYRLSYATEAYACPYILDYPDYSGIFRGCAVQSDNSKLPCINWNNLTSTCTACYTGYTLVNGKCVDDVCPAGQYRKYGQCLPNPTGCAVYSDFALCTQCSTGYTLTNGVCTRTPLTCTGRTYFNSNTWTCNAVNDKCK